MLAAPLFALAVGSLSFVLPIEPAWGQHGHAGVVVNAEVMVLVGTDLPGGGSIDPAIGRLPQLKKPPLSAYNTYRLVDKRTLPLELGKSETYTLVNGRVLQVTFVETTPDHGFHVKAAINQPGGHAYLKLLDLTAKPNEPFFVGGQSFGGGSLVLAITLRR
jgi:hypothetical protein